MYMNEEAEKRYFDEAARALRREGFQVERLQDGHLNVMLNNQPLCEVYKTGGITYGQITAPELLAAKDKVFGIAGTTAEYMRQMESAPQLKAESLEGDYRLLAEFNGTVLAGHPTKYGVQFITWEWVRDRTALWQGKYYGPDPGSYAAAKQGFATRSGLVPKSALFTPEQLTEVYRSVHETLHERKPLTEQRRKLLEETLEQIEDSVPDLAERVSLSCRQEQELKGMESPEDGGMRFC